MESEYASIPLGRLAKLRSGYPFKSADWTEGGFPVIKIANVKGGRIVPEGCAFVSPHTAQAATEWWTREGDVLIAMTGYVGEVARVRKRERFLINQRVGRFEITPASPVLAHFLFYALQHPEVRSELETIARGSAQPNLSAKDAERIEIPVPEKAEQVKIVELLAALDDRIDLLRQTNATLESIAQALFKSWFIDFDPVRAKAEGREPEGMDAATVALFPAEFEESALGLIPKGWQASTLAEHVTAERGLSYKGAGLCDAGEGMPMHNLNSVLEGGGYKYTGLKHYSGEFKDRHTVNGGEVIVANTEQGHEHRLIGFPAIVPMRFERAIFSHHLYRVRLRPESPLTVHTLYFMLMAPSVREQVIGCANGSTVNMLKVAGVEIPQFVCPSHEVATAFEAIAKPLRRQSEANVQRANVLTELRDTLLPHLISGKLRLPEAQEQLDEALA